MKTILKVLVGSRAHGLHTPDSDYDYRSVFVNPTSEILKLGGDTKQTTWIEGEVDDTAYELSRFLFLATKSNPSILEMFAAPVIEATAEGQELLELFPKLWAPKPVKDAFCGYSKNQQVKFLDNKDGRSQKFSVAYLRTLWQAQVLLTENRLPVLVDDEAMRVILKELKYMSQGKIREPEIMGFVLASAESLRLKVNSAFDARPDQDRKPDLDAVNDFLLRVRKNNW
jgi:predicted nucleotidyltransferase